MAVTGSGPFVPGPHRRLTSPGVVKELLARGETRPKRGYGQNFLVDANVLRIITGAAALEPFDTVIEVGPGLGALTQALVEQSGKVYAIESDQGMVELRTELSYVSNLVLIEADALGFDLTNLWEGPPAEDVKMVSNLPYQIAATLIIRWLKGYPWLGEYTVMVQREVADRIVARPGGKDYSSATVKIQHRATVDRVANVSRNSFYPRPRVDSSIVRIVRLEVGTAGESQASAEAFDRLVTAAFGQRRKKLTNSVPAGDPAWSSSDVARALATMGLGPSTRAEELTPVDFERLAKQLGSGLES